MIVEKNKALLAWLIEDPAWILVQEGIDRLIEDRRVLLETIDTSRKEVKFDWYDMLRMDIDNLKELKNLPKKLSSASGSTQVDYWDQL